MVRRRHRASNRGSTTIDEEPARRGNCVPVARFGQPVVASFSGSRASSRSRATATSCRAQRDSRSWPSSARLPTPSVSKPRRISHRDAPLASHQRRGESAVGGSCAESTTSARPAARASSYCTGVSKTARRHCSSAHSQTNATTRSARSPNARRRYSFTPRRSGVISGFWPRLGFARTRGS